MSRTRRHTQNAHCLQIRKPRHIQNRRHAEAALDDMGETSNRIKTTRARTADNWDDIPVAGILENYRNNF